MQVGLNVCFGRIGAGREAVKIAGEAVKDPATTKIIKCGGNLEIGKSEKSRLALPMIHHFNLRPAPNNTPLFTFFRNETLAMVIDPRSGLATRQCGFGISPPRPARTL
jgi:hypothetical protein